jgi:outer membrane receptor protein involved in Fe transport
LTDAQAIAVTTKSTPRSYAGYATDVITIAERLNLMLSVRYNYYDNSKGTIIVQTGEVSGNYRQGSWAPKLGFTYQVVKDKVALFANLWLSYSFIKGRMKGLGAGFGGNYISETFFDDQNTLTIPSNVILNAVLYYNTSKFRLSFKLDNLTGKKYWDISGLPQMPARLLVAVAYKF